MNDDQLTSKVWVRSVTLDRVSRLNENGGSHGWNDSLSSLASSSSVAAGVAEASDGSSSGTGSRKKAWEWTLARLISGALDSDDGGGGGGGCSANSQSKEGAVIVVEDESSVHNGKKMEIPPQHLYSKNAVRQKGGTTGGSRPFSKSLGPGASGGGGGATRVRRFGGSAIVGTSSAGKSTPAKEEKSPSMVANIVLANPSDEFRVEDLAMSSEPTTSLESSGPSTPPPHDLQELTHLHEPSVVHSLRLRYAQDLIYTSTGSNILVALNPFKSTKLYEDAMLNKYAELGEFEQAFGRLGGPSRGPSTGPARGPVPPAPLPPHVFRISDTAFRTMMSRVRARETHLAGLGIFDPLGEDTTRTAGKTSKPLDEAPIITDQSLLVSGESGAGKTVTTKHVLRYLASLSQRRGGIDMRKSWRNFGATRPPARPPKRMSKPAVSRPSLRNLVKAPSSRQVLSAAVPSPNDADALPIRRVSVARGVNAFGAPTDPSPARPGLERQPSWMRGSEIEVQILEANPILESFGNARTIRNDNSSRFGKYIELQFKSTGSLIGANIETYLLEKVRLIHSDLGERNYHIFYEIMEGASIEELKEYLLEGYEREDFKVMSSGTLDRRDGVKDQEEFDSLIESMALLHFDPKHIRNIMLVTVSCMHALNLTFTAPTSENSDLDHSNPHLIPFLTLLGVQNDILRDTLCSYEIVIGGRDRQRRSQSKQQAEKGLEALIKALYSAMFSHLVHHINRRIQYEPPAPSTSEKDSKSIHSASIGILDIFGFESFEKNSFEQLCINYCNEALQQQFNGVVFKSQKEEYDREGIDSSFIKFPDNQDALDLIDKRGTGILSILDDMSFAPATNDDKFANNLYQRMEQNPTTRFEATALQKGKKQFVVHHYAGPVCYGIETFLEKNKEEIPRETAKLLSSSTNPFVQSLVQFLNSQDVENEKKTAGPAAKKKRTTVAKHFTAQLKQLRDKISNTTPYFVRCIKPNQELTPDNFAPDVVVDQLKSLGVLEAVRVSRLGFPKSYTHLQFVRRYRALAWDKLSKAENDSSDEKELCKLIVDESLPHLSHFLGDEAGEKGFQIGITKVFLRPRHSDGLEWLRNKRMVDAAISIQKAGRVLFARKLLETKRKELHVIKIQCLMRRFLATRRVQLIILQMYSATVIQSAQRGAAQRKRYKIRLARWKLKTIAATIIQKRYRGAAGRKLYNSMLQEKEAARLAKEAAEKKRQQEVSAAAAAALAERKKINELRAAEAKKKKQDQLDAEARNLLETQSAFQSKTLGERKHSLVQDTLDKIIEEKADESISDNAIAETKDLVKELPTQSTMSTKNVIDEKSSPRYAASDADSDDEDEVVLQTRRKAYNFAGAFVGGGIDQDMLSIEITSALPTRSTVDNSKASKRAIEQDRIGMDDATRGLSSMSLGSQSTTGSTRARFHKFVSKVRIKEAKKSFMNRQMSKRERKSSSSAMQTIYQNISQSTKEQQNRLSQNIDNVRTESRGLYEVLLPITEHGLLVNITSFHGGVAFASYRPLPDGSAGPAQQTNLIRGVGDKIISVNGEECDGKPFGEIIGMLVKASADNAGYCRLQMQEWMHAYSNL